MIEDRDSDENVYTRYNQTGMKLSGIYPGLVVNNVDPLKKAQLQIRVPQIFGGNTGLERIPDIALPWAKPCVPTSNFNSGFLSIPEVGSSVWVMFIGGDKREPVWLGCVVTNIDINTEFTEGYAPDPQVHIWKSPLQNSIRLSDVPPIPKLLLDTPGDTEHNSGLSHKMSSITTMDLSSADISSASVFSTKINAGSSIGIIAGTTLTAAAVSALFSTTAAFTIMAGGLISILSTTVVLGQAAAALKLMNSNFVALFNSHTHLYSPGPGSPIPTATPIPVAAENIHTTVNTTAS